MAKIVREITVCTDCELDQANGETTGTPDRSCEACTRLARYRYEFVIFT